MKSVTSLSQSERPVINTNSGQECGVNSAKQAFGDKCHLDHLMPLPASGPNAKSKKPRTNGKTTRASQSNRGQNTRGDQDAYRENIYGEDIYHGQVYSTDTRYGSTVKPVKQRRRNSIHSGVTAERVALRLLVVDILLVAGAVVLFVLNPCGTNSTGSKSNLLNKYFGNVSADVHPVQTPPLNQFEPPDSSNEGSEQGNSLSSSYDSSYGSYPPNNDGSGSSVGSNSPSYSNSFGSPSLDGANSQYNPDPTKYSFTTTSPSNSHHSDVSNLFLPSSPYGPFAVFDGKPTHSDDTTKIAEDFWTNRNFQCGVQSIKPQTKVVGGSIAVKHSWPWIAEVMMAPFNGLFKPDCGSTIVSPRHAISAAHCFSIESDRYRLAVGKHDDDEVIGTQEDIIKIRRHPYSFIYMEIYYDLALLTLKNELTFGITVQPACLPPKDVTVKSGRMCWAYGWGTTVRTGGDGFLKQVKLEVASPEECVKKYGKSASKEYTICAGKKVGEDTCSGDSGGSLTCKDDGKWIVYGATSYGGSECGSGQLGAYAAISFSMNWFCCFLDALPECQNIACDALDFRHPRHYF